MNLKQAITVLDSTIPPSNNKMVDMEHLPIAQAWETIKAALKLGQIQTEGRLTAYSDIGTPYFPECFKEPCSGMGCKKKDCPFITQVCQTLAVFEDEAEKTDKGCHWCKMQTDEFGDQSMTASEIKVISRDRFGKRELPRKFCSVCGRELEAEE